MMSAVVTVRAERDAVLDCIFSNARSEYDMVGFNPIAVSFVDEMTLTVLAGGIV